MQSLNCENFSEGLRLLSVAEGLAPENFLVLIGRVYLHLLLEERDLAKPYIERALNVDKSNPLVFINKASLEHRSGDFDSALKSANEAMRLCGTKTSVNRRFALANKAHALIDLGRLEDARIEIDQLAAEKMSESIVMSLRSKCCLVNGELDAALEFANHALRSAKPLSVPALLESRAEVFEKNGAIELAGQDRSRAVDIRTEWRKETLLKRIRTAIKETILFLIIGALVVLAYRDVGVMFLVPLPIFFGRLLFRSTVGVTLGVLVVMAVVQQVLTFLPGYFEVPSTNQPVHIVGRTIAGRPFDLSNWKGKLLVVTWSEQLPKLLEDHGLSELYQKYPRATLEMFGIIDGTENPSTKPPSTAPFSLLAKSELDEKTLAQLGNPKTQHFYILSPSDQRVLLTTSNETLATRVCASLINRPDQLRFLDTPDKLEVLDLDLTVVNLYVSVLSIVYVFAFLDLMLQEHLLRQQQ